MEKDKIFFAESGLTSTSANYVANMAKEMYKGMEQELQAIVFYTTTVKLLDSPETNLLREGVASVSDVKEKLYDIAQLKALIAWLREAIKAKERLITEASVCSYDDFGLKCPTAPVREDYITENDVIATWNIKQRNRYYYLEALCATIGGYIHPGEVFSTQRDELQKILHEPHKVSGSGRDTLLYARQASLPVQDVENCFMELQATYRSYQAELNSLKHQIEETLQKDKFEKNLKYQTECSLYKDTKAAVDAELKAYVHNEVTLTQNLKITIPDSLKPIFDKVSKAGK